MPAKTAVVSWLAQLIAAAVLIQTLFFKFTAAPESVMIFSTLGVEPWGRIAAGTAELGAAILLLIPATAALGGLLALGIMAGAIASHLGPLGIEVAGDGGLLFGLASLVAVASALVVWIRRASLEARWNRLSAQTPTAALTAVALLVLGPVAAEAAKPVNASRFGNVAIKGYDPVAYHLDGKPIEGNKLFTTEWNGAVWRFASAEHRDLFAADPERYAPAYGGWCAYGVSKGGLYDIEPEAWSIVDGQLYLNYNLEVRQTWLKDPQGYIDKADVNWPGLKK